MNKIVTISYVNGHYEIYEHKEDKIVDKVKFPNGNSRDLEILDICSLVENIVRRYEWGRRVKENGYETN